METLISSMSWFAIFFQMFCVIYLMGYFLVFRNWNPKHRPDASSSFISLCHGTPSVFLSIASILSNPGRDFASPNSPFQDLVLEFSIAYFTVDLLHYLVLIPSEYLFIAHHIATLFVLVTCRCLIHYGAFAILILLVLAEVTSACQNVWTLAGLKKSELALAKNVHKILSVPFYAFYTFVRGVLGTWSFYEISIFYLRGRAEGLIPTWVVISWIIVIGSGISVSILWIASRWMELYKEKKGNSKKKAR